VKDRTASRLQTIQLRNQFFWKVDLFRPKVTSFVSVGWKAEVPLAESNMGVWQGVPMDSLKYRLRPPCPTFLRPTGGPLLKWLYNHFRGGRPAGRAACGRLLLFKTHHAVRLWTVTTLPGSPSRVPLLTGRVPVRGLQPDRRGGNADYAQPAGGRRRGRRSAKDRGGRPSCCRRRHPAFRR
jgi:hypothetical protein